MVLGNSMFIPILPDIQVAMNLSPVQGGLILSAFSIPAAVMIPISGFISARYGNKQVTLVSLTLIMIGCFAAAIAGVQGAFEWMIISRLLQGIGAGGITPIAMILITDLFSGQKRNRALGSLEVFNGVGKVISPVIGGIVLSFSWYYSFVVYFAFALFAFFGMYIFIKLKPQTRRKLRFKTTISQVKLVFSLSWKWLVPIYLAGGIGMFILFGLLFYLSYDLDRTYLLGGLEKGLILAIPLSCLTLVSYLTARKLLDSEDSYKRGIIYGVIYKFIGVCLLIFTESTFILIIGTTLVSIGLGMLLPAASGAIAAVVPSNEKGSIFSFYAMIRFLGVALGPAVFGLWMNNRDQMMFSVFFLLNLIVLTLLYSWSCFPVGKTCSTR